MAPSPRSTMEAPRSEAPPPRRTAPRRQRAAARGVLTNGKGAPVRYSSAKRGQIIPLYITGAGANPPAVATGDTPSADTPVANLPKPALSVAVTVGAQTAAIQFIGTPAGLV